MAYKVELAHAAEDDAYAAFVFIGKSSPAAAETWLSGLFRPILSLDTMPSRCPTIREAEEIGHEVRQLLYGKGSGAYRTIFDIDEQSSNGPRVRILRIWHGSRRRLRKDLIDWSA
jgi:plasmid stabilization system protein ParE